VLPTTRLKPLGQVTFGDKTFILFIGTALKKAAIADDVSELGGSEGEMAVPILRRGSVFWR
jgi:hypothetical protein